MQTVHLCRKPIGTGSVAANVLKHGCGALHIDAIRIALPAGEEISTPQSDPRNRSGVVGTDLGITGKDVDSFRAAQAVSVDKANEKGRWPANLVLQHREGCKDGCGDDCPVVDLDVQSGERPSSYRTSRDHQGGLFGWKAGNAEGFDDAGGASRFYFQSEGSMSENVAVPADLVEYLTSMIDPTHIEDHRVLYAPDLSAVSWSELEDSSLHGIIAVSPDGGDPSEFVEEIWRVLKPGAHVLLVAPEDQPTGHTGACVLEDRGFEVRDAILWVREPGHLHYVPKPAQRERHAGCEHLKLKKREAEDVGDDDLEGEDDDLLDGVEEEEPEVEETPDPMWDERNMHKGNVHPTVKPRDLFIRLLKDVPDGAVVMDPFMGSGTTGLACLATGHDFIGIEMEPDYIEIADSRVRYWDRLEAGWSGADIESEAPKKEDKAEPEVDLDDFLEF